MGNDDHWDEIWAEKYKLSRGRFGSLLTKDIIYRTVRDIIRKQVGDCRGMAILEAGSGTGLVSLELAKSGANVHLLDLSPQALLLSRSYFSREAIAPSMVQASILNLPFKNDSFDLTWSGGVIEHFRESEQVRILQEMLRVTRIDGKVIVIAPSRKASTYIKAKNYADKTTSWQPGYEVPIESFASVVKKAGGSLVKEYRTGKIAELHFLKYYLSWWRPLWLIWCGLIEIVSRILGPLNRLPGYLIVAIIQHGKESTS